MINFFMIKTASILKGSFGNKMWEELVEAIMILVNVLWPWKKKKE